MTTQRVFQLSGTCNNYPWGKKGRRSLAAQLCARTPGNDFVLKDDEFYSEMWFGDYPAFPARVLETGEELAEVLQRNKDALLGKKVIENFDAQLPFLPKVRPPCQQVLAARVDLFAPFLTRSISDPLHRKGPPPATPP